ncbi:MAG: hypothetical protein WKF78_11035 [Candidatus Limnocylindrales bacterium]
MATSDRTKIIHGLRIAGVVGALIAAMAVPGTVGAAGSDSDGDGLTNSFEVYKSHTNPYRADTDRDGIRDGREDPDRDRLNNAKEQKARLNLLRSDSDGDGVNDRNEDNDHDGLTTVQEFAAGENPVDTDTG